MAFLGAGLHGRAGTGRHAGPEPIDVWCNDTQEAQRRVLRFLQHERQIRRDRGTTGVWHGRRDDRIKPLWNRFAGILLHRRRSAADQSRYCQRDG